MATWRRMGGSVEDTYASGDSVCAPGRERRKRKDDDLGRSLVRGLFVAAVVCFLVMTKGDGNGKFPSLSVSFFVRAEAATPLLKTRGESSSFSPNVPLFDSMSSSRLRGNSRLLYIESFNSPPPTTPIENPHQDELFEAIRNPRVEKFTVKWDINFTASPPSIVNKKFKLQGKCGEGRRCVLNFCGLNGFQVSIAGPYPAEFSLVDLELKHAVDLVLPDSAQDTNGTGSGAALYANNAAITIKNCVFIGNNASFEGGAIFADGASSIRVIDSFFCSNHAGEGSGGAVMVSEGSQGTFSNVNFKKNTAGGNGGALHWSNSKELIVTKSTFSENYAGKSGGAISTYNNFLNYPFGLSSTVVFCNEAGEDGGGVFLGVGFSTADFCRNMFQNNTAATDNSWSSYNVFVTVSDQPEYWDIPDRVSFCPPNPEGTAFIATSALTATSLPAPSLNGTGIVQTCEYCS